jgi:hypothetical protein
VLTPEAIQLVHQYSKGIPRLINLICEHALISAYVEQVKPVPARIVEDVSSELDLETQPFVLSSADLPGASDRALTSDMSFTLKPIVEANDSRKESEL